MVDNTIFIDDNIEKSILSYTWNAIFLVNWIMDKDNSYLNLEFLLWLRALSTSCIVGGL